MSVVSFSQDIPSSVAPARLFKALCLESHVLIPKLLPEIFQSVEFVVGDHAAVGSVKKLNFAAGGPIEYAKERIDVLDVEGFYCKYSTIEGDMIDEDLDYVVHETKIVASGTGSVCTMSSNFHPKAGAELNAEMFQMGQGMIVVMMNKVQEYLVANPDVYA